GVVGGVGIAPGGAGVAAVAAGCVAAMGLGVSTLGLGLRAATEWRGRSTERLHRRPGDPMIRGVHEGQGVAVALLLVAGVGVAAVTARRRGVSAGGAVVALVDLRAVLLL